MRIVLASIGLILAAGCAPAGASVASPPSTSPPATAAPKSASPATIRTAEQIVAAFKAKGVPVGEVAVYTPETDPNKLMGRPNGYTSKVNFRDTRIAPTVPATTTIEVSAGGSVEVWPTPDGAKARSDALQAAGKTFAPLIEYNYLDGPILVRLSKELTPDQATDYEKALK